MTFAGKELHINVRTERATDLHRVVGVQPAEGGGATTADRQPGSARQRVGQ